MRGRGWIANKGLDPDNRSVIARASLSPSSLSYPLRNRIYIYISLGYTVARLSQTFRVVEQSLPTTTTTSFPSRRSVYKSLYLLPLRIYTTPPPPPTTPSKLPPIRPSSISIYIYIYTRDAIYTASSLWRAAQIRNIILWLSTIWWVRFCTASAATVPNYS